MQSVDLLTVGSWLFSVGDIATAKATQNELAKRDIPVVTVDRSENGRTTVIGGGHVLGHMPHLSHFIVSGRHILNAVGAHRSGDYSYLKEYRYLSVRDHESAAIIDQPCAVVPCPAILLEPSDIVIREVARRRGGHVVVHRDLAVARAIEKQSLDMLVVDPQPLRKCPWTLGGREMETTHCPELMIAAIIGAHAVITRSLHLSIFALCAGVPFACIDLGDEPQSNKLRHYWHRAGMADVMYDGNDPVRHAVSRRHDWIACRDRQRQAVREHFDAIARSLSQ